MTNGIWKPARRKYGVAVVSFSSASVLNSLALQFGETVHIWEEYWANDKTVTWLRGCSFNNKNKKGVFPATYIATKPCTVENEGPSEVVTPVEDAIIKEVTFVLREWHDQWKSLFVKRTPLFQTILVVMGELCKFHGTLVSNTLTKEHAEEMKHQIVTMIDWVNGQLGMDLVPRVDYRQADPDCVSVVEMFRIHERSVKNCQGAYPGGVLKVKNMEKQGEAVYHLLVTMCSFACSVGDNSEVLLSLYDNKESKYISEKFAMFFTRDGQRDGSDKNNSTIFTDLNSEDRKDLYLVVHILRKGRLTTEGSMKKTGNFHYRRPWGVSVFCLRELNQSNEESEYFLRVQCVENESFCNMHENLIRKQIQLIGRSPSTDNKQNQGVTLSLAFLRGDMKNVKVENPILFSKGVVLTQRMGFSDFINPGEIRNDLYLTLHGAELDRGSKTASKNVEVRVTVYNDQYQPINDCIFPASGDNMKQNFLSYVLYHNNSPKWNETIRLSIPIEKFSKSHIRLELCHCSNRDKAEKKMIGFSYLSVTTKENTTRMDRNYDLCIYKCEDPSKVKNYLNYPSLRDDFPDPKTQANNFMNIPYPHSNKEYITVQTLLCSSKFAQKAELLSVLQWSASPNLAKTIPQSLRSLLELKGQELVRYLQDILDALINMFTPGESQPVPFASNIFEALVSIFHLLHQPMFEKFSIVLEDYLEKSFSSPLVHKEIMHCLKARAEQVYICADFDERSSKKVFKVLEDIFKFSVKSCMLAQRISGEKTVKDFRENLSEIFKAFGKVVSSNEKELQDVQAQLLNNLNKAYTPLLLIISNVDLAQLVVFILNEINLNQGLSVIKAKTNLIKNTINSQLFWDSTSRAMLLPLILGHLKKCLVKHHHLELVANTLGDLLTTVYKLKEICDIKEEVTKIIQGVFDGTIITLLALTESRMKMAGSLLVACLTEMLRLMDSSHYQKLIGDHPKPKPLKVRLSTVVMPQNHAAASKDFLIRVLMVFRNLVRADDLPADWTTMRMIISSVMLTSIQYIAEDLTANFLQGSDFDKELWYNFFLLSVDFITQSALQLEQYSEAKSRQIKNQYKDMRLPVGHHIYSLWIQLGQNKQHLMLELIGPFLKSTMVPQLELRTITIPIFFDIMQCEYQLKRHLRRVEGLMIQELDSLVLEHHGDGEYKKLFESILLEKVQTEPELMAEGKRFVCSITDLLERLLNYREIMDREEQRDTKMHCTFNILNFYKDSRRDMYIRYINRLHELHYAASNFVEAGLTLRLYAQLLSWSQSVLQAEMFYPTQTEAVRKEDLFHRIMDCFDKGKAWEYGIPLCKELAEQYEKTFQYKKLGLILQKQAFFFYQILEGDKLRQKPTYYRVTYFGNSFPPYLKNKAFVYRGDECLKLATIMSQLMTEYPLATILTTNNPPDDSCKESDVQFIQIMSVKPIPSERQEFVGKEVPSEISSFYNMNEINTFQFDRPYHRGRKDNNNEFKSLCLERTIIQTTYKLPGILRWYEVKSTQVVQLVPVQTATSTVKEMNSELQSSSEKAVADPEHCLGHLEMRLQGVISGAVNGGIPKYQEAFFNKEYIAEFPDEAPYIEELKSIILEQIHLLEHGLSIHEKFASMEMMPLHRSLADMFIKMKNSMGYKSTKLKHNTSSASLKSENSNSDIPSCRSQSLSGSYRSSVISSDDSLCMEQQKEGWVANNMDTHRGSDVSGDSVFSPGHASTNHSTFTKPPPLPPRKTSQTLGSISEQKQQPTTSVRRSESICSTTSRGRDIQALLGSLPTTSSCSNICIYETPQVTPLIPGKRPSITSMAVSPVGDSGSNASVGVLVRNVQAKAIFGYNNNSANDLPSKPSESLSETPHEAHSNVVPRTPLNRQSVAQSPRLLNSETVNPARRSVFSNIEAPPPIPGANREAPPVPGANREAPPPIPGANRETPPRVPDTDREAPPPVPGTKKVTPPPISGTKLQTPPPIPATKKATPPPPLPAAKKVIPPPVPATNGEMPPPVPATNGEMPPPVPATNGEMPPPVPATNGEMPPPVPATNGEMPPPVPATNGEVPPPVPATIREMPPPVPATNREMPPSVPATDREMPPPVPATNREMPPPVPATNREMLPPVPATNRELPPPVPATNREMPLPVPATDREMLPPVPAANRETAVQIPRFIASKLETAALPPSCVSPKKDPSVQSPSSLCPETAVPPPILSRQTATNTPISHKQTAVHRQTVGPSHRQTAVPPPTPPSPITMTPSKKDPLQPPLFSQSTMSTAKTPPRSHTDAPPPVPQRNPSISPSQ